MRRLVLVALALIAGCDSVLGIEELPGRAPIREPADCGTCGVASCKAERDACMDDPRCHELYSCVAPCVESAEGGPACRRACENKSAASAGALWRALDACRRTNCADECYGFRGFGRLVSPECSCSDDLCEAFLKRCVRSGVDREGETIGGCERRLACLAGRPRPVDPDDAINCTYEDRSGGDEVQLVRFCWQGAACSASCPIAGGKLYECIGKYQWSRPSEDEVPYTMMVNDRRGLPVEGALVEACEPDDCERCARPISSALTKPNGLADLKLTMWGGGFRGCFQITKAGKLPMLWYLGRPVNRSEWLQRSLITSLDDLNAVVGGVGVEPDMTNKGQIILGSRDCLVTPAAGVTFDPPEPPAVPIYIRVGLSTREGPTDDTGQYAIANVAPGVHTIVMRDAKRNELGRSTVFARVGWVTGTYVFPGTLPD